MNRLGTELDTRWVVRSLSFGLRMLLWRWRWILLATLLFAGLLLAALLLLYLTHFGIAWIVLPVVCILLIPLIVIGVQREAGRSRPIPPPPPPRPPGCASDESIQIVAPLNLQGRQAA